MDVDSDCNAAEVDAASDGCADAKYDAESGMEAGTDSESVCVCKENVFVAAEADGGKAGTETESACGADERAKEELVSMELS